MAQNYYDILGVAADASLDAIEAAYQAKLKAMQESHHIDRNQLTVLREVFQVLSNPVKRQMYDQSLLRAATPRPMVVEGALPPETDRSWVKWGAGLLLVAGLAFWWHGKHKKADVVPPQVVLTAGSARVPDYIAPDPEVRPPPATTTQGTEHNAEQIFNELQNSIALIVVSNAEGKRAAIGSGVVIGPGSVITNCHVTLGGSKIELKVGGEVYTGQVEVEDRDFDLCRLGVRGLNANPVRIGQGQSLHSGQKVYAIGAPHGLDLTISDGIVSATRNVPGGKIIQTTAPVSPGSSGGGLFDAWGNLVGIVTFQHRVGQNLNFAVPAEWIAQMRSRGSGDGVGSLTMPDDNPIDGKVPDTARSNKPLQAWQKVLGKWRCHESINTNNLDVDFLPNGRFIATRDGNDFAGTYEITNKSIHLVSKDNLYGSIDELSESRFIINFGEGYRMVCERKN